MQLFSAKLSKICLHVVTQNYLDILLAKLLKGQPFCCIIHLQMHLTAQVGNSGHTPHKIAAFCGALGGVCGTFPKIFWRMPSNNHILPGTTGFTKCVNYVS